jgi:hypothetical protein
MPAVASTTPPVLIAAAAARTSRIRVGSGGVMLPNHAPSSSRSSSPPSRRSPRPHRPGPRAGSGKRPGHHPAAAHERHLQRRRPLPRPHPRHRRAHVARGCDGAPHGPRRRRRPLRHPRDAGGDRRARGVAARIEDYSAQLAAAFGLPYVFANHFSGEGLERASISTGTVPAVGAPRRTREPSSPPTRSSPPPRPRPRSACCRRRA